MGRIPEETIHAIRDRIDLVDLVGRHVTLKKVGRSFKGLCPFHSEKTPSFYVHPERQVFHCFGCGAGGDAFGFLMRQENLTFPEAVRALAREVGIELREEDGASSGLAEKLVAANEVAARTWQQALASPAGEPARRYLAERGIGPELVERFGIGFAPDRWDTVVRALARARIPADVGVQAGLLAERESGGHYDRLRGRVVFPICDVRRRIVGFGGRALGADQEPKYLNTPETPIFHKRSSFYGFPHALAPIREAGRAVVVEGYFDLLALHRAGVGEALATCGTALTPGHAQQLRRRTREVVLLFDGDEAGERAMERALAVLLPEGLRVRAAVLPEGEDPDSLLARSGAEALRALVDAAPPALDRVIRRAVSRGRGSPWEKADAVAGVVPLLAAVPDPVERGEFVRRLALAADLRAEDVEAALRRAARGEDVAERVGEAAETAARPRLSGPEARFAARLAHLLIEHPALAERVEAEELAELVPDPVWGRILGELLAAATAGRLDLPGLADALGGEARDILLALAVAEEARLEAEAAERALRDTLDRLREQRRKAERAALTRQLANDPAAAARLLAEKQRQLEERRAALGVSSRPAPGSPLH